MTFSLRPRRLFRSSLAVLPGLLGLCSALSPQAVQAQALFGASEVEQQRFVLVAAPIGTSGSRYQLNIYEQINESRPCFAFPTTLPAAVNPLLATFDFTGICGRYIDANGYSLRVGGSDLATSYRLMVRSDAAGSVLIALPTKAGAGPEMIVARSGGLISGFHKLEPEPGWRLMRRTYGGRRLGHLYVYSESWPQAATGEAAPAGTAPLTQPSATPPAAPATGASPLPAPSPGAAPVAPAPVSAGTSVRSGSPAAPIVAAPTSGSPAPAEASASPAVAPDPVAAPLSGTPLPGAAQPRL